MAVLHITETCDFRVSEVSQRDQRHNSLKNKAYL